MSGIAFLRENVEANRPFFLQFFHYAFHGPNATKAEPETQFGELSKGERHKDSAFAGITWNLDVSIGSVMAELERLNIADNTYVIFISDNGGPSIPRFGPLSNAPSKWAKQLSTRASLVLPRLSKVPGFLRIAKLESQSPIAIFSQIFVNEPE